MMKNALSLVPRVLLGVMFALFGFNGFVPFIPTPPTIPPAAGAFFGAMTQSHFSYLVFGVQLICGVLLLIDRYVLLALFALAAVIVNIFAFHITMWPAAIVPMPILALVLWLLTAWPLRDRFAPLFKAKA